MAAAIGTRHYIQVNQTNSQAINLSYPISKNSGLGINSNSYRYYSSDDDEDEEEEEETFNLKSLPVEPSIHDPRDAATPDRWILRHPSLIRLTGKHPFNSEPPLDLLMKHGFITPTSVHYVRNHGSVPKADWNTWKIDISGLVAAPMTLTMNQLVNEFPSYDIPVTLACAGNRRNEQNMFKKTKGFNWGPSAISTSVWRGIRLYDLLKRCRIMKRKEGAMNVCFEGGEDLPSGKYGTSIKREFAMDRSRDILIAYMQNGEYLLPDHGFPVRVILPGFIGGRMVKWLKKIVVAPSESDSYYHYKDNKVFPAHVDAELANAEAWWYKPEYIINELNINSVITTPGHEEKLPINSAMTSMPYTMRGYAYSGRGKKVTRVEVTLNGGETWLVCTIERHEKPNKYGKYWCWCFWSLQVEVLDLLSAKEIAVRACDETLNTQPENLNWNLMGMMNNCWFRVKVNFFRPNRGEIGLIFEHPTQPGKQSEGWMAKQNHIESTQQTKPLKKSTSTPLMNTSTKQYSLSEVSKHSNEDSAWIVIHDQVYDCTAFIKDHPGGADSILINAGTDCTEEFEAIHSEKAKHMLDAYRIGELCESACSTEAISLPPVQESAYISGGSPMAALSNPREKIRCTLVSKKIVSKDVRLFRFAFPNQDQVLGLPVGKHIFLSASINGKLCMRAYTPTSPVDAVGYVELLVKIYFKDENSKFPNGGQMSQYLESLTIGSMIDIKGPVGHIEYKGQGNFVVDGKPKFGKKLAMIAGGTGITPLYQVIQAVLQNQENDKTEMHLVYANRTEADVLLKDELDRWQREYPTQFRVWYVCSDVKNKDEWKYSVGRVDESVLRSGVPVGGCEDTLALACGPPQMIQSAVIPNLKSMGYDVKSSFLLF